MDKLKNEKKPDNEFIQIDVKEIFEWSGINGNGCIVSDKITKEGYKVGYMYREQPLNDVPDNGWRFLAGNEDDEYMSNKDNHHIWDINTICNYDKDIIPFLCSDIESSYIRVDSTNFEIDDRTKSIFIKKQN